MKICLFLNHELDEVSIKKKQVRLMEMMINSIVANNFIDLLIVHKIYINYIIKILIQNMNLTTNDTGEESLGKYIGYDDHQIEDLSSIGSETFLLEKTMNAQRSCVKNEVLEKQDYDVLDNFQLTQKESEQEKCKDMGNVELLCRQFMEGIQRLVMDKDHAKNESQQDKITKQAQSILTYSFQQSIRQLKNSKKTKIWKQQCKDHSKQQTIVNSNSHSQSNSNLIQLIEYKCKNQMYREQINRLKTNQNKLEKKVDDLHQQNRKLEVENAKYEEIVKHHQQIIRGMKHEEKERNIIEKEKEKEKEKDRKENQRDRDLKEYYDRKILLQQFSDRNKTPPMTPNPFVINMSSSGSNESFKNLRVLKSAQNCKSSSNIHEKSTAGKKLYRFQDLKNLKTLEKRNSDNTPYFNAKKKNNFQGFEQLIHCFEPQNVETMTSLPEHSKMSSPFKMASGKVYDASNKKRFGGNYNR